MIWTVSIQHGNDCERSTEHLTVIARNMREAHDHALDVADDRGYIRPCATYANRIAESIDHLGPYAEQGVSMEAA